jgi:hypothetical protein
VLHAIIRLSALYQRSTRQPECVNLHLLRMLLHLGHATVTDSFVLSLRIRRVHVYTLTSMAHASWHLPSLARSANSIACLHYAVIFHAHEYEASCTDHLHLPQPYPRGYITFFCLSALGSLLSRLKRHGVLAGCGHRCSHAQCNLECSIIIATYMPIISTCFLCPAVLRLCMA